GAARGRRGGHRRARCDDPVVPALRRGPARGQLHHRRAVTPRRLGHRVGPGPARPPAAPPGAVGRVPVPGVPALHRAAERDAGGGDAVKALVFTTFGSTSVAYGLTGWVSGQYVHKGRPSWAEATGPAKVTITNWDG